jgi:hypothetical protein
MAHSIFKIIHKFAMVSNLRMHQRSWHPDSKLIEETTEKTAGKTETVFNFDLLDENEAEGAGSDSDGAQEEEKNASELPTNRREATSRQKEDNVTTDGDSELDRRLLEAKLTAVKSGVSFASLASEIGEHNAVAILLHDTKPTIENISLFEHMRWFPGGGWIYLWQNALDTQLPFTCEAGKEVQDFFNTSVGIDVAASTQTSIEFLPPDASQDERDEGPVYDAIEENEMEDGLPRSLVDDFDMWKWIEIWRPIRGQKKLPPWEYAFDWPTGSLHRFSSTKLPHHCVRRRCWTRRRQQISALAFVRKLVKSGNWTLDAIRNAIQVAPRESDIIDLDAILTALLNDPTAQLLGNKRLSDSISNVHEQELFQTSMDSNKVLSKYEQDYFGTKDRPDQYQIRNSNECRLTCMSKMLGILSTVQKVALDAQLSGFLSVLQRHARDDEPDLGWSFFVNRTGKLARVSEGGNKMNGWKLLGSDPLVLNRDTSKFIRRIQQAFVNGNIQVDVFMTSKKKPIKMQQSEFYELLEGLDVAVSDVEDMIIRQQFCDRRTGHLRVPRFLNYLDAVRPNEPFVLSKAGLDFFSSVFEGTSQMGGLAKRMSFLELSKGAQHSTAELTLISLIINGIGTSGRLTEWRTLKLLLTCFRTRDLFLKHLEWCELFGYNEKGKVPFETLGTGELELLRHSVQQVRHWTSSTDCGYERDVSLVLNNIVALLKYIGSVISKARSVGQNIYNRCQMYFHRSGICINSSDLLGIPGIYDASGSYTAAPMIEVHAAASDIIQQMMENNAVIRSEVEDYFESFVEASLSGLHASDDKQISLSGAFMLMSNLLAANQSLAERIPESALREYANFIEQWGLSDTTHRFESLLMMNLFTSLIGYSASPSQRLQSVVLRVIMSPGYTRERVALTYHDPNADDSARELRYREREVIIEASKTISPWGSGASEQVRLEHLLLLHHASTVRLLGRCCINRNTNNILQCTRILPLQTVFQVIESNILSAEREPPELSWRGSSGNRATMSIARSEGLVAAHWGHGLIVEAFCVYLNAVYLSQKAGDAGEDEMVATLHQNFPRFLKILEAIASILKRFADTVEEHYRISREPDGMQIMNDDEVMTANSFHVIKLLGISTKSLCNTLQTNASMNMIYGGLIPVVLAFFDRYYDFVPQSVDLQTKATLRLVGQRLHSSIRLLGASKLHVGHISRVCNICGWFTSRILKLEWLPTSEKCVQVLEGYLKDPQLLVSEDMGPDDEGDYVNGGSIFLTSKRAEQLQLDIDLLEGTDFTNLDELHSNGILFSSLPDACNEAELKSKCAIFGAVRLVKMRDEGSSASVYFAGSNTNEESDTKPPQLPSDWDGPVSQESSCSTNVLAKVAFKVDFSDLEAINETECIVKVYCQPTSKWYKIKFNQTDTPLAILGRIQGIVGIHVVDLRIYIDGREILEKRDVETLREGSVLTVHWNSAVAAARMLDGWLIYDRNVTVTVERSGVSIFTRDYVKCLKESHFVQHAVDKEFDNLVQILLNLTEETGGLHSTPCFVEKVVFHVRALCRDCKNCNDADKRRAYVSDDGEYSPYQAIKLLRCMILGAKNERPLGRRARVKEYVPIKWRTDDDRMISIQSIDTYDHDPRYPAIQMQHVLNEAGGTEMLVDLLGIADPGTVLFDEVVSFGLELLDGGNSSVQDRMEHYIISTKESTMMVRICDLLHKVQMEVETQLSALRIQGTIRVSGLLTAASRMITLLQYMAEGHHKGMQRILRDCRAVFADPRFDMGGTASLDSPPNGESNTRSTKILLEICNLIVLMIGQQGENLNRLSIPALNIVRSLLTFIIEVCQGPNYNNQVLVATTPGLITCLCSLISKEPMNHRLMRFRKFTDFFFLLKHEASIAFMAMLEARKIGRECVVRQQFLQHFDLDVLRTNVLKLAMFVSTVDKTRLKVKKLLGQKKRKNHRLQLINRLNLVKQGRQQAALIRHSHRDSGHAHLTTSLTSLQKAESNSFFDNVENEGIQAELSLLPDLSVSAPDFCAEYSVKPHEHICVYMGIADIGLLRTLAQSNGKSTSSNNIVGDFIFSGERNGDGEGDIESEDEDARIPEDVKVDDAVDQPENSQDDRTIKTVEERNRRVKMKLFVKNVKKSKKHRKNLELFEDSCLSIEVAFNGQLVETFFPRPAICTSLSEEQKLLLHESLDYSLDGPQLLRQFFIRTIPHFASKDITANVPLLDELEWKFQLAKSGRIAQFVVNDRFQIAPWVVALVINMIIVLSIKRAGPKNEIEVHPPHYESVIFGLGWMQLGLNAAVAASNACFNSPLLRQQNHRHYKYELHQAIGSGKIAQSFFQQLFTSRVLKDYWATFSPPVTLIVAVQGFRAAVLYQGTYHDESNILRAIVSLSTFLSLVPLLDAARDICRRRPAALTWASRIYVDSYDVIFHPQVKTSIVYFAMNLLALTPTMFDWPMAFMFFFAFQLLALLHFSPTLRRVGKAVSNPIQQLGVTALFGVVVIYIFMVVAFWLFYDDLRNTDGFYADADEEDTMCKSIMSCFAVFLVNGLLTGGGIGEFISAELGNTPPIDNELHAVGRYIFDLLFFVIITILLLNLIFGIILDTFSSMRERASDQLEKRSNRCVICGLQRQKFEVSKSGTGGRGGGWNYHYKEEHNMWHYFFFAVHLQKKPRTEYTGIEKYVHGMMVRSDLSWIPRGQALAVADEDSDDEEFDRMGSLLSKIENEVGDVKSLVATNNDALQTQIKGVKQSLLKLDHATVATAAQMAEFRLGGIGAGGYGRIPASATSAPPTGQSSVATPEGQSSVATPQGGGSRRGSFFASSK